MRKFLIAIAILGVGAPAGAYYPGQIEKRVDYYDQPPTAGQATKLGSAIFYCDGTIETTGMIPPRKT